jgi:hypothetical protein
MQSPMPASALERWLHRKAVVGIVGVMVANSDAHNPQKWTLPALLLQS